MCQRHIPTAGFVSDLVMKHLTSARDKSVVGCMTLIKLYLGAIFSAKKMLFEFLEWLVFKKNINNTFYCWNFFNSKDFLDYPLTISLQSLVYCLYLHSIWIYHTFYQKDESFLNYFVCVCLSLCLHMVLCIMYIQEPMKGRRNLRCLIAGVIKGYEALCVFWNSIQVLC